MRWFRSRDRRLEEWGEAIQPELRAMGSPPPSEALLDRILASRARDVRVILPHVDERPTRAWSRLVIPAVCAAALLLLAIPFRRAPRLRNDESSSVERVATEWIPTSVAFAQTEKSSAPLMQFANADRLRPVTLEYARVWRDSAREIVRTTSVVTLQPTVNDGLSAWLLVSRNAGAGEGRPLLAVDSVTVRRSDLRLLRRTALLSPYRRYDEISITQDFRANRIDGGMIATGRNVRRAQRPIARTLPPELRPYIVDAFGPVLLGAVQLHAQWRGTATMVGWAVRDDDVSMPIELRVLGEEVVDVPAGRFDCWRLEIRYGGRTLSFWVRQSDGVAIRSLESQSSGAIRESVLVKATVG